MTPSVPAPTMTSGFQHADARRHHGCSHILPACSLPTSRPRPLSADVMGNAMTFREMHSFSLLLTELRTRLLAAWRRRRDRYGLFPLSSREIYAECRAVAVPEAPASPSPLGRSLAVQADHGGASTSPFCNLISRVWASSRPACASTRNCTTAPDCQHHLFRRLTLRYWCSH